LGRALELACELLEGISEYSAEFAQLHGVDPALAIADERLCIADSFRQKCASLC